MTNRTITTRTAIQWLDDDGIGRRVNLPDSNETLSDAIENIAACTELSGGRSTLALIDGRNMKSITKEAREYYTGEETVKITKACALLVSSPLTRTIGNFFFKINKPKYPMKLFSSEIEAIAWLKGFEE